MSDFEIAQERQDDVEVLHLKGQLDAHSFPQLQDTLERIDAANPPRVVLDCSGLEYVSSAGLGVLKKMSREFRQREGDLRLSTLQPKIANVIDLLGFSAVIKVFPSKDDAVDSFRAS